MLAASPAAALSALDAFLIGVTDFFRGTRVFESLAADVVPLLAALPQIRVWSAGCSNGAELYSFALLLAEAGLLGKSQLVGTDCRGNAVESAAGATWPSSAVARINQDVRSRYFVPLDDRQWQAGRELRDRTSWRVADVLADPEPGPWHVQKCIYRKPAPDAL